MPTPRFCIATLLTASLALAACGGDDRDDGRMRVAAGFYPLAYVAERVAGPDVSVADLTPSGAEPHGLELTPKQVDALATADATLVMGNGFQPAVEEIAERRHDTVRVFDELVSGAPAGLRDDPHIWLDPVEMARIVTLAEDALVARDPAHAARYEANAARLRVELDDLDGKFRDGLARCKRRTFVTAHAAFGWLARRYDLEQAAIAGVDPEAEPDADSIAALADLARREHLTTIFTEPLVSARVAETVAREAGDLRVAVLQPIEALTDEERADGADYFSLQRANLTALRSALDCA